MSVVVRMEMPKWCGDCPCVNGEYGYCQADAEGRTIEASDGRPSWCPIICSLPEGHGDLIDRDAYEYPGDLRYEEVIIPAEPPKEDA